MLRREAPESKTRGSRDAVQQRFLADCTIRAAEGEGKERTFILSFSSEDPYKRWWGTEILSHKDGAVKLDRINSIGCLLFNHNRDKVLGKVIRAWVENNRGYAEVQFDTDEEAEIIFQKVSNGTLKGVSVGYRVLVWEKVEANQKSADGRFVGPCEIATSWEPYEISIVSVPADSTVGVGRSEEYVLQDGQEGNKGVSSFYYVEKQLQINNNLLNRR